MIPRFSHVVLKLEVPSLKRKHSFRPFFMKEEKLLLMAKSSDDSNDILEAIKQVVHNCSLDDDLDVEKIAIFDLEYLFLRLRAAAIDNEIEVSYLDSEDKKVYDFAVDVNAIKVEWPENPPSDKIKVDENSGLVLRYPRASLYSDRDFLNAPEGEVMTYLMADCITNVWNGDEVYEASDYRREDLISFVNDLEPRVYSEIERFLESSPKMRYVIEYKNSKGTDRKIELSTLTDFFTLD